MSSQNALTGFSRLSAALTSKAGLAACLLFIVSAVVAVEVAKLRLGSASAMGPGYFPAILGILTAFFGLLLVVEAWRQPGERVQVGPLKPMILLLLAIVIFALLYEVAGAVGAITGLVVVSAMAESGRTVKELLLLVVVVIALFWAIFILGLGLQIEMLPGWIGSW